MLRLKANDCSARYSVRTYLTGRSLILCIAPAYRKRIHVMIRGLGTICDGDNCLAQMRS
jgi:hypothetical protein